MLQPEKKNLSLPWGQGLTVVEKMMGSVCSWIPDSWEGGDFFPLFEELKEQLLALQVSQQCTEPLSKVLFQGVFLIMCIEVEKEGRELGAEKNPVMERGLFSLYHFLYPWWN